MTNARSIPSTLLTSEENELIFSLVGPRGQSKATTVVQMFHAHPDPTQWRKYRTGVLCLVKDHQWSSYFIRLFDITARTLVFEQEIYKQFVYSEHSSLFHSFPGDSFMVGLNFADKREAFSFFQALKPKLKQKSSNAKLAPLGHHDLRANHQRSRSQTLAVGAARPPFAGSVRRKSRRVKSKEAQDNTLCKELQQLTMLGFDPETRVFDSAKIDPQWLKLLNTVGVTSEQLKNMHTAMFILEFVEKHGGIQEANRQLLEASRSPPTSPVRSRAKSVMIRRGKSRRGRGQRPPIQHLSHSPPPIGHAVPAPPSVLPPVPPPPPPVQSNILTAPPLPPVGVHVACPRVDVTIPPPPPFPTISCDGSPSVTPHHTPVVSRDLLADIQAGFQLRPVDTTCREKREKQLTGMAAALANALSQRSRVIQQSDEDDNQEEGEEEWEDWEFD